MPRMLSPSGASLRRSNGSLSHGSRTSLSSFAGSVSSQRRPSMNSNYDSQFSLRRSSMNNGSAQSSTHSFYGRKFAQQQQQQGSSKQNAVWNFEGQGPQGPPSLVTSEGSSVRTGSSSISSSQSSLQSPSVLPIRSDARDMLIRYNALRRATLQHPTRSDTLPGQRRGSLQHPTILHATNSRTGSTSFLPQTRIEEEKWGQFVDVADAEEELVRRSKLLSVSRYPANFSSSSPAHFR